MCEVRHLAIMNFPQIALRTGVWRYYELRPTRPAVKKTRVPHGVSTTPSPPPKVTLPLDYIWSKEFLQKKSLMILHCNTTYLPINLTSVFPFINSLFVWYSGLNAIHIDNFKDIVALTEVDLQNNNISDLGQSTFALNIKIKKLNLSWNRIVFLPRDYLNTLTDLEWFLINNNEIETFPSLFQNNKKLKYVNLSNNRIKSMQVDFSSLPPTIRLLGMNNVCMDFFITKRVSGSQMQQKINANNCKWKSWYVRGGEESTCFQ